MNNVGRLARQLHYPTFLPELEVKLPSYLFACPYIGHAVDTIVQVGFFSARQRTQCWHALLPWQGKQQLSFTKFVCSSLPSCFCRHKSWWIGQEACFLFLVCLHIEHAVDTIVKCLFLSSECKTQCKHAMLHCMFKTSFRYYEDPFHYTKLFCLCLPFTRFCWHTLLYPLFAVLALLTLNHTLCLPCLHCPPCLSMSAEHHCTQVIILGELLELIAQLGNHLVIKRVTYIGAIEVHIGYAGASPRVECGLDCLRSQAPPWLRFDSLIFLQKGVYKVVKAYF